MNAIEDGASRDAPYKAERVMRRGGRGRASGGAPSARLRPPAVASGAMKTRLALSRIPHSQIRYVCARTLITWEHSAGDEEFIGRIEAREIETRRAPRAQRGAAERAWGRGMVDRMEVEGMAGREDCGIGVRRVELADLGGGWAD